MDMKDELTPVLLELTHEEAEALLHLLMNAAASTVVSEATVDTLLVRVADAHRTATRQSERRIVREELRPRPLRASPALAFQEC